MTMTSPIPMPRVMLTKRDLEILCFLYMIRLASTPQIQALFFGYGNRGRESSCQNRLTKLSKAGYIDRWHPQLYQLKGWPHVYTLGKRGLEFVTLELGIQTNWWKSSWNNLKDRTILHDVPCNDVIVCLLILAQRGQLRVLEWIPGWRFKTDARGKAPKTKAGDIREPDFYLCIERDGRVGHFTVEWDRGTYNHMSWSHFKGKIEAMMEYRRNRAMDELGKQNIPMLTFTDSETRCTNLLAKAKEYGADGYFWFTSESVDVFHPEVLIQPIWQAVGVDQPMKII